MLHLTHLSQFFPQIVPDKTYWGMDCWLHYKCGPGYVISWDLVRWISTDPLPAQMKIGSEDWMTGEWFFRSNVVKNFVSQVTGVAEFYNINYKGSLLVTTRIL